MQTAGTGTGFQGTSSENKEIQGISGRLLKAVHSRQLGALNAPSQLPEATEL